MLVTFNSSSLTFLSFDAEGSANDSAGEVDIILRKEGIDAHFTFEVDASLGSRSLGEVK